MAFISIHETLATIEFPGCHFVTFLPPYNTLQNCKAVKALRHKGLRAFFDRFFCVWGETINIFFPTL